jgi:hypothetical protein
MLIIGHRLGSFETTVIFEKLVSVSNESFVEETDDARARYTTIQCFWISCRTGTNYSLWDQRQKIIIWQCNERVLMHRSFPDWCDLQMIVLSLSSTEDVCWSRVIASETRALHLIALLTVCFWTSLVERGRENSKVKRMRKQTGLKREVLWWKRSLAELSGPTMIKRKKVATLLRYKPRHIVIGLEFFHGLGAAIVSLFTLLNISPYVLYLLAQWSHSPTFRLLECRTN